MKNIFPMFEFRGGKPSIALSCKIIFEKNFSLLLIQLCSSPRTYYRYVYSKNNFYNKKDFFRIKRVRTFKFLGKSIITYRSSFTYTCETMLATRTYVQTWLIIRLPSTSLSHCQKYWYWRTIKILRLKQWSNDTEDLANRFSH